VLSLLVIEDLFMALYLPILTALLAGVGLVRGSVSLLIALTAVGAVLIVALRFGGLVESFLTSPNEEVLLLKVLGLTLAVAGLASLLQVSAAVGAFLVGIAVAGPLAHSAAELVKPLRDLFAAVFFVFFGLSTDPRALLVVAPLAILLAVLSAGTKITTGYLAARRAGIGSLGRVRAGVALIPRGEFSIVVAGLAVAAGVHADLGPLAAAYVLILAAVGPLVARVAEPLMRERLRRRAEATPVTPER
jgi:CPA2 family monovalent cation:H+ antiporter-2